MLQSSKERARTAGFVLSREFGASRDAGAIAMGTIGQV